MPSQPRDRVGKKISPNAPLHIVLVEPQIPPNAGNVARLCAATGCALHLVEPLGFSLDDRELKRAGLDAFFARWSGRSFWLMSTRATRGFEGAPFAYGDALIFGKETAGLAPEVLTSHPDRTLRIPMRPDAVRSLNLSTAVGIAVYAALSRLGFPGLA